MTSPRTADLQTSPTSHDTPRSRRGVVRRFVAATAAAFVLVVGGGAGPLVASAAAQSSALDQSLGGPAQAPASGGELQKAQQTAQGPRAGGGGGTNLNASPDFSGPGISKGVSLIGWAKAGALVIGVLTLTIGIPASKALKEAGNHHASGIRAGVMSVGGATILAGVAGTLLPWLMA